MADSKGGGVGACTIRKRMVDVSGYLKVSDVCLLGPKCSSNLLKMSLFKLVGPTQFQNSGHAWKPGRSARHWR